MTEKMPVFVKIEEYKELTRLLNQTVEQLKEAKDLLEKIKDIKRAEDQEIEEWENELNDTEVKINEIDKMLLEPESI